MTDPRHVAIVGAGITGLTTAVAALRAGCRVTVFERAPAIAPLGTAISLWPNALNCLETLGLGGAVRDLGAAFHRIAVRHPDGTPLMQFDLGSLHDQHGQVSRCVPRAALQAELAAALPEGILHLGQEVTDVAEGAAGATLTLADGTTHHADLVVAADGQNSVLRSALVGTEPLRPGGYGAVLGLAEGWLPPPGHDGTEEACEYYGLGGRFGVFRSGPDQTYWFFVSSEIPPHASARPADRGWLLQKLAAWPAFTRDMVDRTPPASMPEVAFFDRRPARHWGTGHAVLAGDAAHPMIPNYGQGACQGIEDALAIGTALSDGLIGDKLAARYALTRKRRAESFVKQSRQNGAVTQADSRLGQMFRALWLRSFPNRLIEKQLDWQFTLHPAE